MLYGLGMILLLLSGAFVGGSAAVPMVIATVGITMMIFGRRPANGREENPER